jgi:hypothetical protein
MPARERKKLGTSLKVSNFGLGEEKETDYD